MSALRVFTGQHVFLGDTDGAPRPATITVDLSNGKIVNIQAGVKSRADFPHVTDENFVDAGDKYIIPGLVDTHVHLDEPGRVEWEGFWTGTRAAASGGVTTLIDMPLNSIPATTTVANLEQKRTAAKGQCWVDVGFWGGVVPGNQEHLKAMVEAGVRGFKCFLINSGLDDFPHVTEEDLVPAMAELEGTSTVLLFHAELAPETPPTPPTTPPDPTLYSTYLSSRPPSLEENALSLVIRLNAAYPALRTHIVHLSASSALPLLASAQANSLPLTAETCFHYLTLTAEDIPIGRPEFKCCPPVRSASNSDALWAALRAGTISCVVSDHSPCVAEVKCLESGDLMQAWGGISALGLGLSLLWTEARKRDVSMSEIIRWVCQAPAKLAGLEEQKGRLAVGWDGDLVVWNPETEFTVTKESLNFKNKLSPYVGMTLHGRVEKTFVRGNLVYDQLQGEFNGLKPAGVFV